MRRRYKTNDPKTKLELDDRNLMKRKNTVQTLSRKRCTTQPCKFIFKNIETLSVIIAILMIIITPRIIVAEINIKSLV